MSTTTSVILAAIVAVWASARLTRLVTFDSFPPIQWIRDQWDARTSESGWNELLHCAYCFGTWAALPIVVIFAGMLFGWGVFLTLAGVWWVFCSWLAVGYLAGIIVAQDWG